MKAIDALNAAADEPPVLCYANGYLPQRDIVVISENDWRRLSLARLVERDNLCGKQVFLAGGPYAADHPDREWLEAPAYAGYTVSRLRSDPAGCRVTDAYGRHADVTMTSAWFGHEPGARQVDTSFQALYRLAGLLRGSFGERAHLYATPARTGLDLARRCLLHDDRDRPVAYYPRIPDAVAASIRAHIGQGRMEYVANPHLTFDREYERLFCYDARWMFASCLRMLPTGPVTHDYDVPDLDRDATGFYRVRFHPPREWQDRYDFGLLPAYDEDTEEYCWPYEGGWSEGWCGSAELALARDYGWSYRVLERILWYPQAVGADPLRGWRDRLVRARERVQVNAESRFREDAYRDSDQLVVAALRAILIGAVGGFYRADGIDDCVVADRDAWRIPRDVLALEPVPSLRNVSHWRYRVPAPLSADLQPFVHPEWPATVWSRARARTNAAALRYADACRHIGLDGHVLMFRSDGIVVTDPLPPRAAHDLSLWPADTGKPGCFRLKPQSGLAWPDGHPIELPATQVQMEALWRGLLAANREEMN